MIGLTVFFALLFAAPPAAAFAADTAPAHVRRGDAVEARRGGYQDRLERFYRALFERAVEISPDLAAELENTRPKAPAHGYQVLPRLAPDLPSTRERPRALSLSYSWPLTERLIEREEDAIRALGRELEDISGLTPTERRGACEQVIARYRQLLERQRTIDAHVRYNQLWQAAIATDRAGYDRMTALHDAALERQAILDALGATDDAGFEQALRTIAGIDPGKSRGELVAELKRREEELARKIEAATTPHAPRALVRVERPEAHLWIVRVPVYTDIDDGEFVGAVKTAIERIWRLREGEDEYRVELAIVSVPLARLYGSVTPPAKGEAIDLPAHVSLFREEGAVLTTGAKFTHVLGRAIILGPHDIAPRVLAHEFGHILGFRDIYFRGYKDLAEDGFQVMEVIADPGDIMGAPGTGPVTRRHFERIIESQSEKKFLR